MSAAVTAADEALELLDAMDLLMNETKITNDRRGEVRVPFFRPVTIRVEGPEPRIVHAFSRDLSPMGIGLVHAEPLEPGEVILTVPLADEEPLCLHTELRWSQPFGEQWHVSGGRVLSVASPPDGGGSKI